MVYFIFEIGQLFYNETKELLRAEYDRTMLKGGIYNSGNFIEKQDHFGIKNLYDNIEIWQRGTGRSIGISTK